MDYENQKKIGSLVERVLDNGECTRTFEVELTKFVNSLKDISVLESLRDSNDESEKVVGIYGLFIYYRHMMEYDQLDQLLRDYGDCFTNRLSLSHLRTIFYIDSDIFYSSEEILQQLNDAYRVTLKYQNMASRCTDFSPDKKINVEGSLHAFADLFATYCERYETLQPTLVSEWYKRALSAIDAAIQASPNYAKYYCTRGRILAQTHEYDDALNNIQKAIRLESPNSNKENYSLRIMQYQSHKINIQARLQIYKLDMQQARINADMDKMKSTLLSNVEIIGFFAGIISLVIGSLNLAEGQTAKDAASLILILLGSQVVVFDCFSMLLHMTKKNLARYIVIFIVGALIVIGGIYLVL